MKISVPFGTALTDQAELPKDSARILGDPYVARKRPVRTWLLVLVALGLAAVAIRLDSVRREHHFWQANPTARGLGRSRRSNTGPDPTHKVNLRIKR